MTRAFLFWRVFGIMQFLVCEFINDGPPWFFTETKRFSIKEGLLREIRHCATYRKLSGIRFPKKTFQAVSFCIVNLDFEWLLGR